jgi:hypothetical protein
MKTVRRAVAVTLVATALCADRAIACPCAAPSQAESCRTLVGRLAVRLRRTVATVHLLQARSQAHRPPIVAVAVPGSARISPQPLSPFQFRLPPPGL